VACMLALGGSHVTCKRTGFRHSHAPLLAPHCLQRRPPFPTTAPSQDTAIKGVTPAVSPDQLPQLLAATRPFRDGFLATSLGRLNDAVSTAFPAGGRALPSPADVQKAIGWVSGPGRAQGGLWLAGATAGSMTSLMFPAPPLLLPPPPHTNKRHTRPLLSVQGDARGVEGGRQQRAAGVPGRRWGVLQCHRLGAGGGGGGGVLLATSLVPFFRKGVSSLHCLL